MSLVDCSMGVRHEQSPRPCLNAWVPSTPGACVRSYEYHTPDTLQMRQFGASQTVCQYLKGSSTSGWSSLGIWLGQPRRKIITVSSPLLCVRHLTGGDPLDAQEPPGSERSMRTSSPRTLGSTRHGGRPGTGRSVTDYSYRNTLFNKKDLFSEESCSISLSKQVGLQLWSELLATVV